jgi:hypothetical protein
MLAAANYGYPTCLIFLAHFTPPMAEREECHIPVVLIISFPQISNLLTVFLLGTALSLLKIFKHLLSIALCARS